MSRGRTRSHWVKTMWQGAGINPFMLGWTPGLLTVRSANLVRAGSRQGGRGLEKSGVWGMICLGLEGPVASWMTGG